MQTESTPGDPLVDQRPFDLRASPTARDTHQQWEFQLSIAGLARSELAEAGGRLLPFRAGPDSDPPVNARLTFY